MNEKIKIISDGKIAEVYIDGKKVSCTDITFIGHSKNDPMLMIDVLWNKIDEDGKLVLSEDGLAVVTEGIKINC